MKRATASPAAGSESPALKLWVVLARAYSAVGRHVAEDIARHGLTVTEFGILEALHHKGPLLLGEIQRKVLVTSGGITYLVDRLVEKGLVRREECPTDRRARFAVLTPEGSRLIAAIFPSHAERIEAAMGGLTPQEQRQAAALLRTLGLSAAEQGNGTTQGRETTRS
jgi:MarR family transcriptional regulator, 2-MHQ and catechol-resistance regulon repressor